MSFAFDGVLKSCIEYKVVKGVGLRCKKFQKGLKHPTCGSGLPRALKGGGRSQNYIRGAMAGPNCKGKVTVMKSKRRAVKKSRRAGKRK